MAIQKVSDLPILRKTSRDFDYGKVKPSLIEISYKVSSDEVEGVSRYQSRAVTVAELANYILSAQDDDYIVNSALSGDVFLNASTDGEVAQDYVVTAKTGDIDVTAFNSYTLSSREIKFSCGDGFNIDMGDQNIFTATKEGITIASDTNFSKNVFVPDITDSTKKKAAVNLGYLEKAIPAAAQSPFILFETKYLDYDVDSKNWINTTTADWLLSSDFPDAFDHLSSDWRDGTDYTVRYEKSGFTFGAKKAPDGHIVCLPDVSADVEALFGKTGSAWIYVIDPGGLRFKLPRNGNFARGCEDIGNAGNYVPPTIPEHTHQFQYNLYNCTCASPGGIKNSPHGDRTSTWPTNKTEWSGGAVGNTVSPPAVQMHLYMYCS